MPETTKTFRKMSTTKREDGFCAGPGHLLTCDVRQPKAFPRQTVIRMKVDPNVVLGGQVGGW